MLNRRYREHKLYDWFHKNEQLSALLLSQTLEITQTLGYKQGAMTTKGEN